jgi:hypothetical protein
LKGKKGVASYLPAWRAPPFAQQQPASRRPARCTQAAGRRLPSRRKAPRPPLHRVHAVNARHGHAHVTPTHAETAWRVGIIVHGRATILSHIIASWHCRSMGMCYFHPHIPSRVTPCPYASHVSQPSRPQHRLRSTGWPVLPRYSAPVESDDELLPA